MNVFPELTRQLKQRQLERDEAAAKKMRISLQEYYEYKKAEEQQKIEHENYLKRKGITEEQYQRKLQRKKKREEFYESLKGCALLLGLLGVFILSGIFYFAIEEYKTFEAIVLIILTILLLGFVLIYFIVPIFVLVWVGVKKLLDSNNVITALLTFIIASTLIVGFVYSCSDLPSLICP